MQQNRARADSVGHHKHSGGGLFAEWQPRYAEHGIVTFPVRIVGKDKKPAVPNYLRLGLGTSAKLVKKFGNSEALGFAVRQAGITVLDIDSSDERSWGDLLDRHGHTPVLVRTGSGYLQAWYRHNGESRLVRPWPDCPADLLGDGYVTAPPSRGGKCGYKFIQGGLDDIDRLPVLQGVPAHEHRAHHAAAHIKQGSRNDALFRYCMRQAHHCDDFDQLLDVARTYADQQLDRFDGHHFTDEEVVRTAKSAWTYTIEGKNRFGRHGVWFDAEEANRLLVRDQDLFLFLSFLRANNGPSAEFMVANTLAERSCYTSPFRGWSRQRLSAVRSRAEKLGYIECIRRASYHRPALYKWPENKRRSGCQESDTYPQQTPSSCSPAAQNQPERGSQGVVSPEDRLDAAHRRRAA